MTIILEETKPRGFEHPFALLVHGVQQAIGAAVTALGEWRAARRLGQLDDATFKDLGISRGNVDWLVRNGTAEADRK